MAEPLLAVRDLRIVFTADEGQVEAVAGVSLDVKPNRTLAVVAALGPPSQARWSRTVLRSKSEGRRNVPVRPSTWIASIRSTR